MLLAVGSLLLLASSSGAESEKGVQELVGEHLFRDRVVRLERQIDQLERELRYLEERIDTVDRRVDDLRRRHT